MPGAQAVSVVVPVYNSEATLQELVRRVSAVFNAAGRPFEIILVDDGSADGSWTRIEELSRKHPEVRGVNLMRNYGQHNAVLCGVREARHPFIVTLDDDLQNPPEEAPKLLAKLDEGYDVVYGTPEAERHGLLRDLASRMTKLALANAMGINVAGSVSAFRAFRTELRQAFAVYRSSFVSVDVLLTWATTRFAAVKVRHDTRKVGVSNYTVRKLITHALNMLTGFSVAPLQVASLIGFFFAFFGLLVLVYVVGRYLLQGTIMPGFPFLASIIAIFSGAQLFALGITGEYLARIHFRIMEKPQYMARQKTDA